jgi:hypothetical protein
MKSSYPELERISDGPKQIAAAIERGKGKVYERVYSVVSHAMESEGYKPARKSSGRLSVDPHEGRVYCKRCRQAHTKGQHRFHGEGSFHRTHLFSFNQPMTVQNAKRIFAHLMEKSRSAPLNDNERKHLARASLMLRSAKRGKLSPNPKGKERFSFYLTTTATGASKFVGAFDTFAKAKKAALAYVRSPSYSGFIVGKKGKVIWSKERPTRLNPRVSRGGAKRNPCAEIMKLGRALEVRYQRSIGRSPGYYKHEIETAAGLFTVPGGWVFLPGKSVVISKGVPRKGK